MIKPVVIKSGVTCSHPEWDLKLPENQKLVFKFCKKCGKTFWTYYTLTGVFGKWEEIKEPQE